MWGFKIIVTIRPGEDQDFADPAHVKSSRKMLAEFKGKFGKRCEDVRCNITSPDEYDWVNDIEGLTRDSSLIFDVNDWVKSRKPKTEFDIFGCYVTSDTSPESIALARWVDLDSDFADVECGPRGQPSANRYPVACEKCGWLDLEVTRRTLLSLIPP